MTKCYVRDIYNIDTKALFIGKCYPTAKQQVLMFNTWQTCVIDRPLPGTYSQSNLAKQYLTQYSYFLAMEATFSVNPK